MKRRTVIKNFDDFVEEAKMLPAFEEPQFAINNPLEQYFMDVADKHGVLDEILDGEDEYE